MNKHIIKLSTVLKTTSISTFLVVGLNGCDSNCSNLNNLSQSKINECLNSNSSNGFIGSSGSSRNSGYFSSTSSHHGG